MLIRASNTSTITERQQVRIHVSSSICRQAVQAVQAVQTVPDLIPLQLVQIFYEPRLLLHWQLWDTPDNLLFAAIESGL
jgi:hypothetical protein